MASMIRAVVKEVQKGKADPDVFKVTDTWL